MQCFCNRINSEGKSPSKYILMYILSSKFSNIFIVSSEIEFLFSVVKSIPYLFISVKIILDSISIKLKIKR